MELAENKHDIVAAIKKRYGSVPAFETEKGLCRRSVSDVLRGRKSRRTQEAVAEVVGHSVESLFRNRQSAIADVSATRAAAHRQNAGAD